MKALRAKGLARVLYKIALTGFALSLIVHVAAIAGFYSTSLLHFEMVLIFGVFIVGIPAILFQSALYSGFSFLDHVRLGNKASRKILFANAPAWLRASYFAVPSYTVLLGAWIAYKNYPSTTLNYSGAQLLLSAVTSCFYIAFALVFSAYGRAERPLRPDEI
jgi:hypothetical protein